MNKLLKTIFTPNFSGWKNAGLIFSIAVFSAGFLLVPSAQAQNLIDVDFEYTPLFDEANFAPGDSVTRWIEVTNNSDQPQNIAIKAEGYIYPVPNLDLSRALMIIIREGDTVLYGDGSQTGPKTLFNFYETGEIHLSEVESNTTIKYEFEITFPSGKGNEWQGKTTRFDLVIGFDAPAVAEVFVGAGGAFRAPLTIRLVESADITTNSVAVEWFTNHPASSRVIYAPANEGYELELRNPPRFGYRYTTATYNIDDEVSFHRVIITDLIPGTTYYFRAVSYSSAPTISRRYSFTTLGVVPVVPEVPVVPVVPVAPIIPIDPVDPVEPVEPADPVDIDPADPLDPDPAVPGIPEAPEIPADPVPADLDDPVAPVVFGELGFVAAAAMVFEQIGESPLLIIIVILCLMGLAIIGVKEWKSRKKKKKIIAKTKKRIKAELNKIDDRK